LISGDWVGEMERALEAELPPGGVALYCNGAQGDQSVAGDFGAGFERAHAYGAQLAAAALKLAERCEPQADSALKVAYDELSLPEAAVPPALSDVAGTEQPLPPQLIGIGLRLLFPPRAPLHLVRLGDDTMLIAVPGEAITQIGLELKQRARRAGAARPFIAGLANVYCGYILTPEEYDEGGYEAGVSFYGREFGPLLVDALSQLIAEAAPPEPRGKRNSEGH
ncbi:MAG: neutral/alkaline non-lysosomal ceramidase N-terminal domain-containing protein, partial [Armatimonadota bacterium]